MNCSTVTQLLKTLSLTLVFTASLAGQAAAALDLTSKESQQVEGLVGSFVDPGLFWLDTDSGKILVYTNGEASKDLRRGQKIRVTGFVPLDWAKFTDLEINAKSIETR